MIGRAVLLGGITLALAIGMACGGDSDTPTSPGEVELPADWRLVEATSTFGGFSLGLPPGWQLNQLQGIDSYVGEIVAEGVRLEFDFGWYSNPLADDDDPLYIVTYEDIGGRQGKLVKPKAGTNEVVGVYFENMGGSNGEQNPANRLQISGAVLDRAQLQLAFTMFRTIRGLETDASGDE